MGDLFTREGGALRPRLKRLEVPVRAFVAPVVSREAVR